MRSVLTETLCLILVTEFPLVDQLEPMLKVADELGIPRLKPIYRSPSRPSP